MPVIENGALTAESIPSPTAQLDALSEFALSFDGYEYWGSFEKCADIVGARRHSTLTELRTCLFFEQRRWHHFGEPPDDEGLEYIRELIEKIRTKVLDGEID